MLRARRPDFSPSAQYELDGDRLREPVAAQLGENLRLRPFYLVQYRDLLLA